MKTASAILKKHEDENELHFHNTDRKFIIEAMEEYAKQFKYDFRKHCRCKHTPGSTWCCNICGLPIDNKSINYKKPII